MGKKMQTCKTLSKQTMAERKVHVSHKDSSQYMEFLSNKIPMLSGLGFNKVIEKHVSGGHGKYQKQ